MHDTVTKLMSMVDLLCSACVDDVVADDQAIPGYESCADKTRQALQDELTLLFTPLTPAQIHNADQHPHIMFDTQRVEFARAIEVLHGITGEKNETDE